jgi:hypothetical protein
MKNTKIGQIWGVLALVLGVMLTGCNATGAIIGGVLGGVFLFGGYNIGSVIFISIFLAIVGSIVGTIITIIAGGRNSGSSGSGSNGSLSDYVREWTESREKDPHTCRNCTKYHSRDGYCRFNGNPMSAEDSCDRWC